MRIERTDSTNENFVRLVKLLDADLAERDGGDHAFYAQFNTIDHIKHVVVVFEGDRPVGCGAIKAYDSKTMEIKRMYTVRENRGKGVATVVLRELERWAAELSCLHCVLETGKRQPEAIALYKKNGYTAIPNYGQYADVENSVCLKKDIG